MTSSSEVSHLDVSLRKIAKGAGIGFTGTFIGMALGYFSRMIIARFLGPGDYGLISLGLAGMTIAATLSMVGLPTGIVRYVSFYKGKGNEGKIKGTILGALKISFPLSIIFALLFFFGAGWISFHVFHEPNLTPVLRIFAIGIPFWVLASNFIATTVGFQDLRYRVYVNDLFQNILKLVAIVILLALGFGVLGAAIGWVLAIIAMSFLAAYFLERRVFSIFNTKIKSIPMERELFSFSWPLMFVGVLALITGLTDTLMLGYFESTYDVGIYNAALPTASLMGIAAGSFAIIFMPVISELYSKDKIEELRKTYSTVTKWIVSLVFPGFLLMFLFSRPILRILWGSEYVIGAIALSILAFGYLISACAGLSGGVISAFGRTKQILGIGSVGASANFALNLYLIPLYGINGAAVATASSIIVTSILSLGVVYHISKLQPFRLSYLKPVLTSTMAALLVYAITETLFEPVSSYVLIPMFFVFLIVYFFLLLLFKGFEKEDLMIMKAIEERSGIKSELPRKIIKRFL